MNGKMKWKPSKAKARQFAETMNEIRQFCLDNNIEHSNTMDSYYFTLNGKAYRISNHSVEASNARAYDDLTGEQIREEYHKGGRDKDTVYIHASKTRIMEIYSDLKSGYELDGNGNRKDG